MEATTHKPKGRPWRTALIWLLIVAGLAAAYANPWLKFDAVGRGGKIINLSASTFYNMWQRWFPAWRRTSLSLYDRIMEGESYYTHSPLVPLVSLLMAVLILRHTRVPVRPRPGLGALVLGGSLGLHLLAVLARVNFASGFTLIGVAAGLILVFWGATALRRLWFPVAFLAFMVPLPEVSISQLNFRLKMMAAGWGVRLANVLGVLAERSGNKVFLAGDKQLIIANVCNGLRTLISLLAFGAIYAYVCKLRGVWRLGLFAMSVPVAVVSNALRIVSLIVVADLWTVDAAVGAYHDISGLFIYGIAFLLMFSLERAILGVRRLVGRPAKIRGLFEGIARDPDDEGQWPRLAAALGAKRGWLCVALVAVAAGGTWWFSRSVPSSLTPAHVARAVPSRLEVADRRWEGRDHTLDENTLTVLEWPDYLFRIYEAPGAPRAELSIIFSRDNRKGTHPPDLCMEGGGQDITHKASLVVGGGDGSKAIPCRELVTQKGAVRMYHLYVYRCAGGYTGSFWKQQLVIFLYGLFNQNASGALMRVSTPLADDLPAARRRAKAFLVAAAEHMDRNLPWPGRRRLR
jgi:EpsI family protein